MSFFVFYRQFVVDVQPVRVLKRDEKGMMVAEETNRREGVSSVVCKEGGINVFSCRRVADSISVLIAAGNRGTRKLKPGRITGHCA